MAQPDVEDVLDALLTSLQDNLPQALQTVDARKSTQLHPQAPRQYIFGDYQALPQLPAVLVTCDQTTERRDELGWREQQYTLTIEAYYTDTDLQRLSRILRRYAAAIDDTLRQDNTLGGMVRNMTAISQRYSQTMRGQPGLFQAVTIEVQAHLITD
ncbi:MAG: hypothetical protein K6T78_12230 [Alicyclobacillus sp.]|nr:hypothetical protein [Alicyclobacillus sp.]